jgi:hypothetical protein
MGRIAYWKAHTHNLESSQIFKNSDRFLIFLKDTIPTLPRRQNHHQRHHPSQNEMTFKQNFKLPLTKKTKILLLTATTGTAALTLYTNTTTTDSFTNKITSPIHAVPRSSRAISTVRRKLSSIFLN